MLEKEDILSGKVLGGSVRRGTSITAASDGLMIGWKIIRKASVESVELVTEENKKRIFSALGWGALGLLLGPVGGIAGLVFGGRTKEICFALYLKDGRKYLITSDPQTYQSIKALCF